jgi:hypothetical protein
MADVMISGLLAERLQSLAQQERRPVEAVLEKLLDSYGLVAAVPEDVDDKVGYLVGLRELRPKLYQKARAYWQQVGDTQRLALTDAELDSQFWCIDGEGIPRLKSDQAQVQLPPDPLAAFVNLFADSTINDASTTSRETLASHYQKRYARSD